MSTFTPLSGTGTYHHGDVASGDLYRNVRERKSKYRQQIPVCSNNWISRCVIVSLMIAAPSADPDSVAAPPLMKRKGNLSPSN